MIDDVTPSTILNSCASYRSFSSVGDLIFNRVTAENNGMSQNWRDKRSNTRDMAYFWSAGKAKSYERAASPAGMIIATE